MRTTCILFSVPAILWALAASPAAAKEDPLDFVHLLQKEGYNDVAIDYLLQLKADPNTPKEVMEVWDLEMSRSEKEALKQGQAYNNDQAKQWADESKTLLEGFIKANPNRAEAIQETARQAEETALEGQYAVLQAGYTADKEERAKLLAKARAAFEKIRPRFVKALESSIQVRDSLPKRTPKGKGLDARIMVGENRLAVAMVDFYLAQTLEAGSQRTADLTKCTKEFDAIYQEFRAYFVGWRAHFWNGRILQEQGQINDAKAVYEEVAACDERNIAEVGESTLAARSKVLKKTGLEDFFADVEQYYLQTLYQLSDKKVCKEYLEEAGSWRTAHKANSEKCFGYQALTLELAKNLVEIGNQSKDEAMKKKRLRQALTLLGEMAKIPSPYLDASVKLRRELKPSGTTEVTFEDTVMDGDQALDESEKARQESEEALKKNDKKLAQTNKELQQKKLAEAVECYEKGVAAANKDTDPARLVKVKNLIVVCYHNQAMELYKQGKKDDAVDMAKKGLKPGLLQSKAAPGLAVFMLNVQYYQYLEAADKAERGGDNKDKEARDKVLAKVTGAAKAVLKFWASKEEGDAARIVLMRLALAQADAAEAGAAKIEDATEKAKQLTLARENMAAADKVLGEINPASKEYPKALTVMGFAHWYKYKTAKKQLDGERAKLDEEKTDLDAKKAKPGADKKTLAADQEQLEAKTKKVDAEVTRCADDRKQAVEYTEKAVKGLEGVPHSADAAVSESLRESQLLLAEMYKEGEDFKKSVSYYQPLIDDILKNPTRPFDDTAHRIFDGACQAYLQLGDTQKLAEATTKLMELGQDQGPTNMTLMNLARRLEIMRKKAREKSDSGDAAAAADAAAIKPFVELEEKILINLSTRDNISPASMIWIVKTASDLGTGDADKAAADLVNKIRERDKNDQDFHEDPIVKKAMASLDSLGAKLMERQGNYQGAVDAIDEVVRKYPKALDPQLKRAEILTNWAAHEPAKYNDAIVKWDSLRKKLERISQNTLPSRQGPIKVDPKYEVVLKEADCFFKWAKKTNSDDRAKTGLELLKNYLELDRNIRSPSAEYQEISAKYYSLARKLFDFPNRDKTSREKEEIKKNAPWWYDPDKTKRSRSA